MSPQGRVFLILGCILGGVFVALKTLGPTHGSIGLAVGVGAYFLIVRPIVRALERAAGDRP